MRVPGLAWSEDSGHVVDWFLDREFVSIRFSFDDEHCAYNLMSCRDVQQHWFANVRRGQDRVCCQYGFYFFEPGRGGIRPLEVFGAPEEALKW